MGYVSKDIAVITEPEVVTLAAAPNFVQFASKPGVKTMYEATIGVNVLPLWMDGYYAIDGVRVPVSSNVWYCSRRLDVSTYVGNTFTFNGWAVSLAYCHFLNTSGGVISSFQTTGGVYTSTVPVGAKYIELSNRFDVRPTPTFMIGLVNLLDVLPIETISALTITDNNGVVYTFYGTTDTQAVGGNIFFIGDSLSDTAENLRGALLNNAWLAANFDIRIPFTWLGNTPINGRILNIKSKGAGVDYNIVLAAPNNTGEIAYTLTTITSPSINNDSISGENTTAEIELDIYTAPAVFLGQDDRPITNALLGTYAVSLQKTYTGIPIWFELNALFSQYGGFKIPGSAPGWYDTGTIQSYRFVAKKKAVNSFSFYQSAALFVVNGYGPASEQLDLAGYTYGDGLFNLLTNKPVTPYVRGQRAFLNFIFKDVERSVPGAEDYTLRVAYRAYSTSGTFLGVVYAHPVTRTVLNMVNTCVLNIDAVLDVYPKAGFVRVNLVRGEAVLTNELSFQIRPECLHKLTQFVFLNRLGGWDAFNFDAAKQGDIKPSSEVFSKTIKPGFKKGDSVETVYSTSLSHTITVEGAPIADDVAEWLKELAAARVVLDGDGNYIIIEDFNLKTSAASQDMQIPTIKYHLSEKYTND